jgi:hypothetical protein
MHATKIISHFARTPLAALFNAFSPRHARHRRINRAWALGLAALFLLALIPSAHAAILGLRQVGTGLTTISAAEGSSVDLELFLDTQGLSLEGYVVGIDINAGGGSVSGISVAHQTLPGLFPDLFGPPVIDDTADTVRNDGQRTFTTGLGSGVYVLDILSFVVDAYGPSEEIIVTPGLFGEALGLGGGSCPGTVQGCSVAFESATVIPEPSTALLMGLGLAGLGASGRKRPWAKARTLSANA